jgi:hypothetical protein
MRKTKDNSFEERVIVKGGFFIEVVTEPCFTCGHKKQIVFPQKTDGRVDIIRKCMYCSVKNPTFANRNGV